MKTSTSARSPLSPTRWPREAFPWWGSLLVLFVLLLGELVPPVIALAVLYLFKAVTLQDLKSFSWPLLIATFAWYAAWLGTLLVLLPILAHRSLAALGLRAPSGRDIAWGIGGAVAMFALVAATAAAQQALFHVKPDEVQVQWLRAARGALVPGIVLLACFAAPFVEELAFRGFVFNALLRYAPAWLAAIVSGVLFGLAHFAPGNQGALAPLAAGGIVLAAVYYRSGSLVSSMMSHGLFNAVTVVAVLAFHQTS